MPELPNATPRHLIHGSASAFTALGGVPTDFNFTYGTWDSPDGGEVSVLGVISDYTQGPIGDEENLKDGSGATFAHVIKDPGWEITCSVMVRQTPNPYGGAPKRMSVINFWDKVEGTEGPSLVKAVVKSCTKKWSREGWTMLEIKAEARDSMNLGETFGVKINEKGQVATLIYPGV